MINLDKFKIPKINIEKYNFIPGIQTRLFLQYSNIVKKTEVGQTVVEYLKRDKRVKALEGKMISSGSSAGSFELNTLAMWFLWCANENGIEVANDCLNSFLDSEEITAINVLWVLGFEVEKSIKLKDGYSILPINEMLDSNEKESFLRHPLGLGPPVFQINPQPKSAITKSCSVKKIQDEDPSKSFENDKKFFDTSHRLYEIALLLNTISGVSCLPFYSTSHTDSKTPFGPFGGSGGGSSLYDVIGHGQTKLEIESKAMIDKLRDSFNKLDDTEKKRIKIVLERISQAKRRDQIEEKILDLGISLEMLLLQDNPNNEQLSLTFRLRGSWLLGKTPQERVKIYRQLREIYNYRSQVAHSGVLCKGDFTKIDNVRKSFIEYQSLAEEICQKIIINGKPDWNKLLLNAN